MMTQGELESWGASWAAVGGPAAPSPALHKRKKATEKEEALLPSGCRLRLGTPSLKPDGHSSAGTLCLAKGDRRATYT